MLEISSIPVVTVDGDSVEVVISGPCNGPIRFDLTDESEFLEAVRADSRGEVGLVTTVSCIQLSASERSGTLKPPSAGHWRVTFPTSKVESVTATVVPAADNS